MRIPLDAIRAAAERTAPHLHRTPTLSSRRLGERAGVRLDLKCESFQKTGSFKPRGALNIVLALPEARRASGLVTVSAGNHAQAVAWVAQQGHQRMTIEAPALPAADHVMLPGIAVAGVQDVAFESCDNGTLLLHVCRFFAPQGEKTTYAG